jgi:hypothetical protein
MTALGIMLFIVAGLTAFATLTTIATATKAGSAVAVTIINSFCIVVEILSAIALLRH